MNAHDEFKYGWDADGNLIKWDVVSPSYAHFHKEDENFTKTVTAFSDEPVGISYPLSERS